MSDDDFTKDPLVYSEQVKRQMAADPELAEAMREFGAILRQAHAAMKAGQYASFDDAIEALTGERPERIDIEDEDELREALVAAEKEQSEIRVHTDVTEDGDEDDEAALLLSEVRAALRRKKST